MSQNAGRKRRLSVAMIVRNAEDSVAETLASVRHLADEIVVLDTGSTDRTPLVAQQFGANLQRAAWEDSFAAARNQCLTHVSGDWVLWLDAGERLERADAALLREFIDEQADAGAVYSLRIAVPAAQQLIGGEQIARIRLHPNRPGLQFFSRVRENLDRSLTAFGLRREPLPIVIHRGSDEHAETLKRAKAQRNIQLAELQIAQRGPSADMLNCLGEACQTLGDTPRAMQHYRAAQESALAGSADLLEAFYGLLTCLDVSAERRNEQLQLCMTAVEAFSLDAQLLCALGGYLQSLGHAGMAGRAYDLAFQHGQIEATIWHLPDIREIAATCRALVQQSLGADQAAEAGLLEARLRYPHSLRLTRQLLELTVKQGRQEDAAAILDTLPRGLPELHALRSAAKGACLAARGNWPAAKTYLDLALAAGCRERFCLRWLTATCLALELGEEAAAAIAEWSAVEGDNPEIEDYRLALEHSTDGAKAVDANGFLPPSVDGSRVRIDGAEAASAASEAAKRRAVSRAAVSAVFLATPKPRD